MILNYLEKTYKTISDGPVLDVDYVQISAGTNVIREFSMVAQNIAAEYYPTSMAKEKMMTDPVIVALKLLDFLSSKQGFIRRKGRTFRTEVFYRKILPLFVENIQENRPLHFSALCFCTTLANTKLGGESPYPHMASYIALENMHKIALGATKIYSPGIELSLGFEGFLFQSIYFHTNLVLENALSILNELNEDAYRNVTGKQVGNPIEVVDAISMIEQTYGSYKQFKIYVEERKRSVSNEDTKEWREWYEKTASPSYFPSKGSRECFIEERARWRHAVLALKRQGGKFGGGFIQFNPHVIPFTPSGRQPNVLALQMIPESSFLPHQRVITHEAGTNRWRMKAYYEIQEDDIAYAPCYIERYSYPFYFEKVQP